MNNKIILKGLIRDIDYSHSINDIEYDKANLIVKRKDGKEDVLSLRFKKFSNIYEDNQEISLVGNVRSYSQRLDNGKNKVNLYVFTYFDLPETVDDTDVTNEFEIEGRICKIDELRTTQNGKHNIHFVIANNIISSDSKQKINSYLPMVCWGKEAKELAKLHVSDLICVKGQLHSREYKKVLENGETEFRVAHEGVVTEFQVL